MFSALPPEPNYSRYAELVKVVSGDTFDILIDNGRRSYDLERIGIYGTNTPKLKGPEAVAAGFVIRQSKAWFGAERHLVIDSLSFNLDVFPRIHCLVWCHGMLYNHWLREEGYAWPVDKSGQIIGERNVDLLNVPDSVKQAVREAMA